MAIAKDVSDNVNDSPPGRDIESKATAVHQEQLTARGWKLSSKKADGDTALALFEDPEDAREAIDPAEEKKLVRRIDFMILPYLAVCYAFFYIDKTTLSYAAIFGIQEDLHLHGTQYNWLSSLFYFGFLAWVSRTTSLHQQTHNLDS